LLIPPLPYFTVLIFYVEIILFLFVLSLVVSGLKLRNMDGLRDIWCFYFNV